MQLARPGTNRARHDFARGSLELWPLLLSSGPTLIMRCVGHASIEFAEPIATATATLFEKGRPVVFDDWECVTGYDSALRVKLTEWHKAHEDRMERTHILVGSRLLAMGVSVANLVMGGRLDVYASRREFEAQLARRVPHGTALSSRAAESSR